MFPLHRGSSFVPNPLSPEMQLAVVASHWRRPECWLFLLIAMGALAYPNLKAASSDSIGGLGRMTKEESNKRMWMTEAEMGRRISWERRRHDGKRTLSLADEKEYRDGDVASRWLARAERRAAEKRLAEKRRRKPRAARRG